MILGGLLLFCSVCLGLVAWFGGLHFLLAFLFNLSCMNFFVFVIYLILHSKFKKLIKEKLYNSVCI